MLYRRLLGEWLLVLLAASLVAAGASWRGWSRPLDHWLFDPATKLIATPPDSRILIVEIDNASIERFGRWPWPRQIHRQMMDALAQAAPAAVDYDVLLLEPAADDAQLAAAMRRAGRVYLPTLIDRGSGGWAIGAGLNVGGPSPTVTPTATPPLTAV